MNPHVSGISLSYIVRSKERVGQVLGEPKRSGGKLARPAQRGAWGGDFGYFTDPDGNLRKIAVGYEGDLSFAEWPALGRGRHASAAVQMVETQVHKTLLPNRRRHIWRRLGNTPQGGFQCPALLDGHAFEVLVSSQDILTRPPRSRSTSASTINPHFVAIS
jgi:hypothetical protein